MKPQDIQQMSNREWLTAYGQSQDKNIFTILLEKLEEGDDLQRTFDLQQSRVRIATKEWQKAHGKPNVLPDLGMLIDWMWGQTKVCEFLVAGQLKPGQKLEDLYCPLCGSQVKQP